MARSNIKYDYANNRVSILGNKYDLDILREWVRNAYRPLLERHTVKVLRRGATIVRYYDWEHILTIARDELIVLEWYVQKNKRKRQNI